MMQDARDLPNESALDTDICIVGAGAAGITLCLQFIGTGLKVVLLESGGSGFEEDAQALYGGSVVNPRLHSAPHHYRQRRFGGSTTIWGGRCVPFDPIDFEQRDYIANSGWPFGLSSLMPYYPQANRLCEAGEFAYTVEAAFRNPPRSMLEGFHSPAFSSNSIERFSCPTDFGVRYGPRLFAAENIQVLLHANVTDLLSNPAGDAIDSLVVRTLTGKSFAVQAKRFVLATGGLEVARLLLASRNAQRKGVGNQHDQVGRYYMCHLAGTIGALTVSGPPSKVWHGYDVSDEGVYCRRRLALGAAAQKNLRIGNFIGRLHHPRIAEPAHKSGFLSLLYLARRFISYEYARRLEQGSRTGFRLGLQHLRNIVRDPLSALSLSWNLLWNRRLADRKYPSLIIVPANNRYSLDFLAEQEPRPESRVTVGTERDSLGMPRLLIDWRYSPKDVETVQRALSLFAQEIQRLGIGSFVYDPGGVEFEMTRYGAYGGHHIGTARMGRDPRSSVTNADGRMHGVENLFVAGAAVFPTSGQANPTLTIVALALRLADHMKSLQVSDLSGATQGWHGQSSMPVRQPVAS